MTDNKSLEEEFDSIVSFLTGEEQYRGMWFGENPDGGVRGKWWWRSDLRSIAEDIKEQRTKDIQKISFHFGIPVPDLEAALASKDNVKERI